MVWDPWREIRRMFREMERAFEEIPTRIRIETREEGYREPVVDVFETDDEVVVVAEMPGVNKEDIKLNATEDTLEIRAEIKKEEEEERKGFYRMERYYGGYYRSIQLPSPVIPEKAKARYKNGVLEIRLPKAEKVRGSRIKIE
ncbi:heat-shock protein Hsp20 [Candidatus Bathyarchaeota archaeon ex4484_205]|nr:MAG: heat-shock protein Hsp20 [Candidatus Bathyarchaeota archaeon ex4484_205]RLF88750.1 MAG: Hsp20/alpha crystallin family protein [Thermococci archaeon]RLF96089.1 MAG: Hsp20/alpha crystallin family protein [Thermococci archaeon]